MDKKIRCFSMKRLLKIYAVTVMLFAFLTQGFSWADDGVGALETKLHRSAQERQAGINIHTEQSLNKELWLSAKDRVLAGKASCQEAWDILWAQSKAGNLEARNALLFTLTWGNMNRPGSTGDTISRTRDYAIIGIHAFDAGNSKNSDLQRLAIGWLKPFRARWNEKFFLCVEQSLSQQCTEIAVKDGLIPTFESYAEDVDQAIARGKKPTCYKDSSQRLDAMDNKGDK